MNDVPEEVLRKNGMHIISPKIPERSITEVVEGLTKPIHRVYWVNEMLKKNGLRLFTFRELESMFKTNRVTIQKIIAEMVENGHLED